MIVIANGGSAVGGPAAWRHKRRPSIAATDAAAIYGAVRPHLPAELGLRVHETAHGFSIEMTGAPRPSLFVSRGDRFDGRQAALNAVRP